MKKKSKKTLKKALGAKKTLEITAKLRKQALGHKKTFGFTVFLELEALETKNDGNHCKTEKTEKNLRKRWTSFGKI